MSSALSNRQNCKHNQDGRTAPGVCGNGSVPLSHSGNVVTRIGIHTHSLFAYQSTGLVVYSSTINTFYCEDSLHKSYLLYPSGIKCLHKKPSGLFVCVSIKNQRIVKNSYIKDSSGLCLCIHQAQDSVCVFINNQ